MPRGKKIHNPSPSPCKVTEKIKQEGFLGQLERDESMLVTLNPQKGHTQVPVS